MDATASSVAASTGRGRGARAGSGCGAAGAAGVAAISDRGVPPRRLRAARPSGSPWVTVQAFGAALARSLIKISLIREISSLVCLQTAAARTSGATGASQMRLDDRAGLAHVHTSAELVSYVS